MVVVVVVVEVVVLHRHGVMNSVTSPAPAPIDTPTGAANTISITSPPKIPVMLPPVLLPPPTLSSSALLTYMAKSLPENMLALFCRV